MDKLKIVRRRVSALTYVNVVLYENKHYKVEPVGYLFTKCMTANPVGEKKAFYTTSHVLFYFDGLLYSLQHGKKVAYRYKRSPNDLYSSKPDAVFHDEAVERGMFAGLI